MHAFIPWSRKKLNVAWSYISALKIGRCWKVFERIWLLTYNELPDLCISFIFI